MPTHLAKGHRERGEGVSIGERERNSKASDGIGLGRKEISLLREEINKAKEKINLEKNRID